MKLVIDTRRFKHLHQQGVNGWELTALLVIEEMAGDSKDWIPLPQSALEDLIGMGICQQSRTLKGLEARGFLKVRRVGFGEVRRHVRLTKRDTPS